MLFLYLNLCKCHWSFVAKVKQSLKLCIETALPACVQCEGHLTWPNITWGPGHENVLYLHMYRYYWGFCINNWVHCIMLKKAWTIQTLVEWNWLWNVCHYYKCSFVIGLLFTTLLTHIRVEILHFCFEACQFCWKHLSLVFFSLNDLFVHFQNPFSFSASLPALCFYV